MKEKCIEYYESQYPELPRYMIEMALDYDLAQGEGSSSNEKPMTNKGLRAIDIGERATNIRSVEIIHLDFLGRAVPEPPLLYLLILQKLKCTLAL